METRNREVLFTGLVVNLEQVEVRIGGRGCSPSTKTAP